ncbi:MAG TPA: hypothetical protein VHT03_02550 [Rhizomicrobium sp.]|jgi:hypothetical protein|nr:hypothetical protein [Rhizomicrobium sp.]
MFVSRHLLAASAAAVFALAASAHARPVKHYHIFPATSFESLARQPVPPASDMNYYGGPVFSNVKVETVMWNSSVLANTQQQMPLFTAALVNSTYVDQLGEYSTKGQQAINGHKSTHQTINRGTYLGQVVLTPRNTSTVLLDRDIQKELKYQIGIGVLPPQDDNTLYMVYFPSNITIILDGMTSCVVFGAYHFATNDKRWAKRSNIFYSVEPECNSGFDYLTFAASHEFAEATTDNVPTPGVTPNYPQAWNDSTGNEIGDKCSTNGTLTSSDGSWNVTQVYLNSLHGCSTTATYTSP